MNVLQLLENGLFALGQVLRFPVMALLWVCVVAAIFMAGGYTHASANPVATRRAIACVPLAAATINAFAHAPEAVGEQVAQCLLSGDVVVRHSILPAW